VLSVDGRQIQQLRSFILRCYAGFKTTSIMTKIFCPNCGNRTLKKVAVSLREDGTQVIHLSSRKRLSGRGKRVS
jgi:RNA-binding protein NOB1